MFEKRLIIQLLALLLFTTTVHAQVIPSNRMTTWKPGVTNNGGIPNRTTIYKTISPSGGDDTPAIQAALDSCPANQVIQLTAGVFKINGSNGWAGLNFVSPNCTLRGVGPGRGLSIGVNTVAPNSVTAGTFVPDPTATQLVKADRASDPNDGVLSVGYSPQEFSTSINLASDAALGTNSLTLVSNPGIQVGEIVFIDQNTETDPDVVWGVTFDTTPGSKGWFVRTGRSLNQIMEVTAVNGNTLTFATPFHITFKTAFQAQLSRYSNPVMHGIGIENIFFYGGMGGNVQLNLCAYCWMKNIESFWSEGDGVGLYGTYRSELRDSFIHETPDPSPGGAGYLVDLNWGASDNLVENNIMWYGNKEIVMRGTGGGNVIAYNYMDDAFGSFYPDSPEAGLNAGHYTTPHMELLEGNYSQNFKGDTYWGNSIYITVFRNHLSGIRAAAPPLNTYTSNQSGCLVPYGDFQGRTTVDVQAYSFYHNFVGNVLGFPGEVALSVQAPCYGNVEDQFVYEVLSDFPPNNPVIMWQMGSYQASTSGPCQCWTWVSGTYTTQLRQGNWDWSTQTQSWDGIGGTGSPGSATPQTIPNSLYLTSKPAFFGSNPWPWVDPSTGLVSTLPAKLRFALLHGNKATVDTHDFNYDNNSDILWRDTSGNVAVWLMKGAKVTKSAAVGGADPHAWSIVGHRDFNGDSHTDLLWRDTSGNVAMWFMTGTQIVGESAQIGSVAGVGNVPTVWSVAGSGDFNGDGKGDILWQNTSTGDVAIWLMNGPQVLQAATVGNASTSVWKIAGTGDFNGDGKTDILWQDTSGNVAIWFMDGAQVTGSAGIGNAPPKVWSIVGTGDFNGDGKSDILWRDSTGNVAIWLMNGAQVTQTAGIGAAPTAWNIFETGDFNGDGKSDLLWQDGSGNVAIWFMNGTQVSQAAAVGSVPASVWSIQRVNAD